jgi:BNR/Asp-box repeat
MIELFAATGDSVACIRQQGDTWNAKLTLENSGAQCLALDPHHPGILYAGSYGKGVWKSSDSGQTWQDMKLPQKDVFSVAVSPADGSVYAGCEPSMLFRSTDGGQSWHELSALRSIPSAPTWSFPPRPWTSHVRWIAPNPHDAALLIVGIELGGLMYSNDGGQTWADHRPNAQRDVHALAWHPAVPGRAYEAGGGGTAWSHDGGQTWQRIDAGRDRHYTWGLAVDPNDPDCWFISACPGPRYAHNPRGNAQAYIYRWRGNGPWQALDGGLPQPLKNFPYALVSVPGQLYAGLNDGRSYVSHDLGDSWQSLTLTGDQLPSILALACVV